MIYRPVKQWQIFRHLCPIRIIKQSENIRLVQIKIFWDAASELRPVAGGYVALNDTTAVDQELCREKWRGRTNGNSVTETVNTGSMSCGKFLWVEGCRQHQP
jgi:hypothetical protein